MIKKLFSNIIISLVLCFFFLFPTNALAGQANLAWDPPDISTDVTGYMIHYGTASGSYSQAIDVGNTTSYTVSNLIDGQTYYFAVTAYNAVGYESVYSNEVSIVMAPSQYLLMISKPGPGQGTVSGSGINCGDTCLAAYNAGTVVSLSASAAPGSTFNGWSGGGCSGTGLCTVTMNANITITANFITTPVPTTVPTTTTTSIPPTTTTTSVPTTISTTTVRPTTSTTSVPTTIPPTTTTSVPTTISTTTVRPTTSTTSVPTTIPPTTTTSVPTTVPTTTVQPTPSTTSVPTTIPPTTFALTVSKSGSGGGTVTSSPNWINCGAACSASVPGGTGVTLTATPASGSTFSGWGGACSGVGTSCTVAMNAAKEVTATFSTASISLGAAVDFTNLSWNTGGDAPFVIETTNAFYGGSAVRTGRIGDKQRSYLSTTVTGPGTLSFYWQVSSSTGYSIFSVYLDGVLKLTRPKSSSWSKSELVIPAGTHTVTWEYRKDNSYATFAKDQERVGDSSSASTDDAGWVDYVVFTAVSPSCTYTLSADSAFYAAQGAIGAVTINTAPNCSWTAVSNDPWITITSGSNGSGNGDVPFAIGANTETQRTGAITIGDKTFTVTQSGTNTTLYFPHVDTNYPWQTEIAIINTSLDETIAGTLKALSNDGQLIESKAVTLSAHGRRQITVANEFTNHTSIGYIIFDTNSAAVQGYTKFYQEGTYRVAIPAVKEVNTSDIYISHIASNAQWWTGVSLVNTTSTTKELTITFNNGLSMPYILNARQHRAFTIRSLFNDQPQPDIRSAVITNASGVIGLELFGSTGGSNNLDGILVTDNTASTLYYPHVAGDGWWTGIVAYNPSESSCTITVAPYSAQGDPLSSSTISIAGKGKYVGTVADLGLPAQTAWFRIDSTRPLSGFELFGTVDDSELAAYAGGSVAGAKAGVFAKIEKNGWTGIAFVNTEDSAASVALTAYNENGIAIATQVLPVGGHAKVVNLAEAIFSQDIRSATYIAYSSDRNVVGFQINATTNGMMYDGGTSAGMMLDGLPALASIN